MVGASSIRVLLIEDNAGDIRLIREMILSDPRDRIELETVETLGAGMRRLDERAFDVILLDLSLPDSHGIETLLRISAIAANTAVVVLTGIDDANLGLQAVQLGAQDYLPKTDVDSKLLRRSLRYALERHRAEAIVRRSEQEYRSLINDVFNTSMVAVMILSRQFRVVWCNEATSIYFGIPRERILGQDGRELIDNELKCIFADPDDYSSRLLKAYEAEEYTDRFECHVLPEDGRDERWLEHWSQPIRAGMYAGGRIEQYMDITDRKKLEIAEEEQRRFAEALRDISTVLTSTLDLKEVLGRILSSLERIVPHDSASIIMLEEDRLWVAEQHHDLNGKVHDTVTERQMQFEYRAYLEAMIASQNPLIVPDLRADVELIPTEQQTQARGYVAAPIRLNNETIGFLNVFSQEANFYSKTHADRLMTFAEMAAIAIQNARLFQQSKALATLQERQRLARDLHDSVSQTLFTCRTMAESALRRWNKDPERAHELTREVYRLTITALAEMRILLLELRPAWLTRVSLKQLFEQYLVPIQTRRQFTLHLAIDDIPTLPADVQIALYRIVQESLNNIDKHARAQNVIVSARDLNEQIELQISDDGVGFDPETVPATSLGLGIIRERADSIQAEVKIESRPGEGTRITVHWRNTPVR